MALPGGYAGSPPTHVPLSPFPNTRTAVPLGSAPAGGCSVLPARLWQPAQGSRHPSMPHPAPCSSTGRCSPLTFPATFPSGPEHPDFFLHIQCQPGAACRSSPTNSLIQQPQVRSTSVLTHRAPPICCAWSPGRRFLEAGAAPLPRMGPAGGQGAATRWSPIPLECCVLGCPCQVKGVAQLFWDKPI